MMVSTISDMGLGFPGMLFLAIFIIIATLIFGTIVFVVVKSIKQWKYNNSQPVLKVKANVIAKRTEVSGMSYSPTRTEYFVTFEFEERTRFEFEITGNEYGMLAEHDSGILTYQGTRYLGFALGKN